MHFWFGRSVVSGLSCERARGGDGGEREGERGKEKVRGRERERERERTDSNLPRGAGSSFYLLDFGPHVSYPSEKVSSLNSRMASGQGLSLSGSIFSKINQITDR